MEFINILSLGFFIALLYTEKICDILLPLAIDSKGLDKLGRQLLEGEDGVFR